MTCARKSLVSLDDTPYYHVIARCVRRASLWGFDEYAGRDYSHRKSWVLERLADLTAIFAVDVCAYAVMSNHYHLVVHVDRRRAGEWSHEEVVRRWTQLYRAPPVIESWQSCQASDAEREVAEAIIEVWRRRLFDLSWFMKCLNEHLARRANLEDSCTGKFWEGRFKSQALLDEAGLLTAMVYVDLNPIRAGIAQTPEESEFTSIYERIKELNRSHRGSAPTPAEVAMVRRPALRPFQTASQSGQTIPFTFHDYLELVDWTGKIRREDKRGAIDAKLPSIMHRLNVDPEAWRLAMRPRGNVFGRALGRLDRLRLHARTLGQTWVRGLQLAARLYA
ncbi:MAG TPA: hypothetical protein VF161_06545 [Steroidobacteraceae bacterium]